MDPWTPRDTQTLCKSVRNGAINAQNAGPISLSPANLQLVPAAPPPTARPPGAPESLPQGWTIELDPSSGQEYYYNTVTGESTWERPAL